MCIFFCNFVAGLRSINMKQLIQSKHYPQARGGLWIIIVAAVVLQSTVCVQYFYSRHALQKEVEHRARTELRRAESEIEKHTIEMETAAKALAMLAEKHPDHPDSMYAATRSLVAALESTSSVAVAYAPNYLPEQGRYFEACSSRISPDSIYTRNIGSASHDYTQLDWYLNGLRDEGCIWCEPYLDDSGSQAWVVSCSYPVHNRQGEVVAVVCIDLSLDYLQQVAESLRIYKGSHCSIVSAQGKNIVKLPDDIEGNIEQFDELIDATGWMITIVVPDKVIFADLRRMGMIVSMMMLIGLIVLIFIIFRTAKNLVNIVNLSNQKERIESELNIAQKIQMAMLPTSFPPFPDVPNLEAYGEVIPAKEVGGDLFDFLIRDDKLYFCIGDVSGKGVPAALVMAVTRSLFRSVTTYIDSPAQIVTQMNDSLSGEGNDQDMFVTLFAGVLDLSSGELKYCNAGHDAPIHLRLDDLQSTNDLRLGQLECTPNLPLGVLPGFNYEEQQTTLAVGDTLFLYTDGLTEAENSNHELFGMDRLLATIDKQQNVGCLPLIQTMQAAVRQFVGSDEQSDDLTMFAIRLIEINPSSTMNDKIIQPTGEHYSLVMRNDIQQIPTLAEWIETIGIPDALNMSINLALEEAVSNVMLYAYPDSSGRVLVEAEKADKQITFTITDNGIPFDPTKQKEADITLGIEERGIGGLGIHLVRNIMDDIRYERKDNKNILTLIKHL